MAVVLKRLPLAMAIWVGLSCSLTWADDSCRRFDDKGDRLTFGRVPLGGEKQAYLQSMPPLDCSLDECIYQDPDGIEYAVIDDKVVKKELFDQTLASYRGSLIAGIAWHDTFDVVRQKLETLPEGLRSWETIKSDYNEDFFLAPEVCLQASDGTVWQYLLVFDKDARLRAVIAFVNGYEAPT